MYIRQRQTPFKNSNYKREYTGTVCIDAIFLSIENKLAGMWRGFLFVLIYIAHYALFMATFSSSIWFRNIWL